MIVGFYYWIPMELADDQSLVRRGIASMIVIDNVTKTYEQDHHKVEAVKNVNLHIQKGEIFGIIGFSGAGKSSLLRCINYLEQPSSGIVRIQDVDLASLNESQLRETRRKMGMIFQHFNLLMSSTVYENVATPLQLTRTPKKVIDQKVKELLELVGLQDKADAYPAQLSGGQKQRVAIARALANDPEILLSDEATSALDPQTTDSILDLLLTINQKYNITIVLITHEMHVIKKICDRVAVMENGEVIEQGSVLELFAKSKHPTTRNFIKSIFDVTLPDKLALKIKVDKQTGKVLRLSFIGDAATEPILSILTTKYPLQPNILFGNITQIKETTFGNLIIKISGDQETMEHGIQFLLSQGVEVEILEHLE